MGIKRLTAAVMTGVAVFLYVIAGTQIVPVAWKHDFLNLYTASWFSRHGMLDVLYDPASLRTFQDTIAPENPYPIPFARPRFYAVLLAPLSLLPYRAAFALWLSTQTALLFGCWGWLARRLGANGLIVASFFFPAAAGIAHGQDAVFLLALAIASFAAFERGRETLSGALAGCLLFKFHLVLLIPVAMLLRRRWDMLRGFAATAAVLGAIELLAGGVSGISGYLHFLTRRDLPGLYVGETMMVNLDSLLLNIGMPNALLHSLLAVLALALVLVTFLRGSWWTILGSASLGAAFLLPHVYQYDLTWALLPLVCAIFWGRTKALRMLVLPLMTPVPYLLNLAGVPWSGATSLCVFVALAAFAWESWKNPDLKWIRNNG